MNSLDPHVTQRHSALGSPGLPASPRPPTSRCALQLCDRLDHPDAAWSLFARLEQFYEVGALAVTYTHHCMRQSGASIVVLLHQRVGVRGPQSQKLAANHLGGSDRDEPPDVLPLIHGRLNSSVIFAWHNDIASGNFWTRHSLHSLVPACVCCFLPVYARGTSAASMGVGYFTEWLVPCTILNVDRRVMLTLCGVAR